MADDLAVRAGAADALRILVVDDNCDAADSLAMLLRLWGHRARVAYDGPGGLRAAAEFLPDWMLLDVRMPGQNGYDLARDVRRLDGLGRAKLVALSAYSDEAHRGRALEAGFDHVLTKPADLNELRRLLAMLDKVVELAEKTEELAKQNVSLATETKELLAEVKEDIKEVKAEVRELKEELREVKREDEEEGDET